MANIAFFGTSEFAVPALKALHSAGHQITVITVPDQPVGRKKVMTAPPVKLAALELDLPVHQPPSLKDDVFFETFKFLSPIFGVAVAYGNILPKRYLDIPQKGFLNIHPSLLPKYRGPTPIQTAIFNGDIETGITVMQLDAEVDHGPILLQLAMSIDPDETYPELHDRLANEGGQMLLTAIENRDTLESEEQEHHHATFTKIFTREDGRIDWSKPTQQIFNQIRALNPEPGTWTMWNDKILNIKKAKLENGILQPVIVQLEGKNEASFKDFLSGYPDFKISDLK